MNLPFKTVAVISAVVAFVIASILFVWPQLIFSLWNVDFSYPAGLVGRRAGALFCGIGIMLIAARNTEPSTARAAIGNGLTFALLLLAALGSYEFITGHAGLGILSAVLVEVLLALAFILAARQSSLSTQ